jgi:hypothetical protein
VQITTKYELGQTIWFIDDEDPRSEKIIGITVDSDGIWYEPHGCRTVRHEDAVYASKGDLKDAMISAIAKKFERRGGN